MKCGRDNGDIEAATNLVIHAQIPAPKVSFFSSFMRAKIRDHAMTLEPLEQL
jgi:hypothetical protein